MEILSPPDSFIIPVFSLFMTYFVAYLSIQSVNPHKLTHAARRDVNSIIND